ncbi:TetR/AcrR family transcriptional regulator [Streptomyces daliensis]|uniref:TetR/AcrR family transcriptional regulator n=1 Tax=Streptomyces daliensis TaxID=299421 RepID=A0A8T4IY40_9ACTN|nr:TetR/AcrR family transcriptional regulator [Streptomyces daliensis]
MGHREDLLDGAKRCLLEKGYARTTARDIVKASGTNLASIGYHYGSKDALMREALFAAVGDWGDDVQEALEKEVSPDAPLAERFEAGWSKATALFERHQRLWSANLEAVLSADDDPELRAAFARVLPEARAGLVSLFNGKPQDEVTEDEARVYGGFYHALVAGLVVQKALAPEYALPGHELIEAMRRIVTDADAGTDTGTETAEDAEDTAQSGT